MFFKSFSVPWLEWGALVLILYLAAFLRFHQLEYKSLWVDEIGQVVAAQAGILETLRGAALHVAAPPLDYLITWLARQVGNNEFILRVPSVLWSLLAVAALYALAKHVTRSILIALIAAYLFTLAPLVVRYAQEVRFYALSIFLTLLCVYAFVRAWEMPTRARWFVFALALIAAFYAHYYIVFILAALVVWASANSWRGFDALAGVLVKASTPYKCSSPRGRTHARVLGFAASLFAFTLCALPWLLFAGRGETSAYIFSPPPLAEILDKPVTGAHIDGAWRAALSVLGVMVLPLCALFGLASLWRTQRAWSVLLALVVSIGVMGVWSADLFLGYFYSPRQLLFLVPYYLILVAAGIDALFRFIFRSRRGWRSVAIAATLSVITFFFALSLRGYYDWSKDDWRSAARLLENARAQTILPEPATLGTYLVYYHPALRAALNTVPAKRVWIVTLDQEKPRALESNVWNAIRLDASPTLNIFYAGDVSEQVLWREAAAFDLPLQVLIYSDLLTRVQQFDPALAQSLARRGRDAMTRAQPPLLDSQQTRLLRKLSRFE